MAERGAIGGTGSITAYLPAAVALVIILTAGIFAERQSRALSQLAQRGAVVRQLETLRARLEATVEPQLQRIGGLAAALAVDPAMDAARFADIAVRLHADQQPLRAVAVAGADGIRLHPAQAADAAVLVAQLQDAAPTPSGARALLGSGAPQVLLWSQTEAGRFAALMDLTELFRDAGMIGAPLPVQIAVTDSGGRPLAGGAFPAARAVLDGDPAVIDLGQPGGAWRLAGVPANGWAAPMNVWPIRLLTLLSAGLIVLPMMRTRQLVEERQRNIRDLRDRETQLERLSRRLGLALDASKVGVWDFNISRDVLVWDARMDELYGLPADGRQRTYADWSGRLHPDDLRRAEAEFRVAIEETGRYNSDYRLALPDGETRHIRAIGAVYSEADGTSKIVGVNWDVTADVLRNAELEAKRLDAEAGSIAKSQFLATMSHEIRTPMNGVLGMLDLLLRTELRPDQRERAEIARESARHLLSILNDVLDFSKLEVNRIKLHPRPVNVASLAREVTALLGPAAQEHGIALTTCIDPTVPAWLSCDPTRLRQVLINLVGNAVKFTEAGSVEVCIAHDAAEAAGTLAVAVRDTGVGISEAARAQLFQRFAQVDSSITRQRGGTGLGLAISKQLVDLMGGEISVESVPGLGSTFRFTVPAVACAAPAAAAPAARLPGEAAAGTPALRILVAEDNPTNQQILSAYLTLAGHTLRLVSNGAEALGALDSASYDVVIMDIHMPVMDGITAAGHIRAMPGAAARIPIIALTADALQGDRERYLAAGMTDYVSKPISVDALYGAIARATPGYSSAAASAGTQPSPGSNDTMLPAVSSVASPRSAS